MNTWNSTLGYPAEGLVLGGEEQLALASLDVDLGQADRVEPLLLEQRRQGYARNRLGGDRLAPTDHEARRLGVLGHVEHDIARLAGDGDLADPDSVAGDPPCKPGSGFDRDACDPEALGHRPGEVAAVGAEIEDGVAAPQRTSEERVLADGRDQLAAPRPDRIRARTPTRVRR